MKNRILAALLAVLMLIPMIIGSVSAAPVDHLTDTFESERAKLETMDLVATSENGTFKLYCDMKSGELAVENTKNGEIMLSNPYDLTENGMNEDVLGQYLSQVYLNFVTVDTGTSQTFYSYADGVKYEGQVKPIRTLNGVVIEYTLGDAREVLLLPNKIELSKFEAIIEQLPTTDGIRGFVENLYTRYHPNEKKADGSFVIKSEGKRNSMIKEFPICATTPIYVIDTEIAESSKAKAASYISKYTDYTLDRLYEDYEEVKEEEADKGKFEIAKKPNFKFNVSYTINNDGFVAELDAGSLQYDEKYYYVTSISILPYFGAAKRNDKGYTFLPDGSGALVRFEDMVANKVYDNVAGTLYGTDYVLYEIKDKNVEKYTMPVFGLINSQYQDNGYFAIIEDGDAISTITSVHSAYYHSIYPSFTITATDKYDLADAFSSGTSSSNLINVKADEHYEGKCTVRYAMLSSDNEKYEPSYVGMAKYYRDYLTSKGVIDKIKAEEVTDFTKIFVEMFGSILVEEKLLTFPVKVHKELTTFDDVKAIHKDLLDSGIGNMTFLLKGFANGGLNSHYPSTIKWQKVLGGKAGFESLLEYAKGADLEIAPDVEFTYSKKLGNFSGFSYKADAIRTLDNRYSTKREYNAATQTFERTGGVAISSASFAYAYEKFYASISDYQISTLAVRSLGSDLNSDFDKENFYDREATKANVVKMLKDLTANAGESANKGYNLIIDSGNSYAVPYASAILGASLDSSRFFIQSEAVPFYGMVYHGSTEFAGNAINMDGDSDYMFLKALENGASLYFTVAMQNTEYLKFDKEYNKYFSVKYSILKDSIVSMYKTYNDLMKDKQDKYIVKHEFMNFDDGYDVTRKENGSKINNSSVVLVVYEGGNGFILNYNSYAVTVNYEGETYEILPFSYDVYTEKE